MQPLLTWVCVVCAVVSAGPAAFPQDQVQLELLLQGFSGKSCTRDDDCCEHLCYCEDRQCRCTSDAYTNGTTCMKKKHLHEECMHTRECLVDHSECLENENRCECSLGYYEVDSSDAAWCSSTQTTFFSTAIVLSVCVLFAAVAIGVVMQIRSTLQRRLYRQQYQRHCRRETRLARSRAARCRHGRDGDRERRFSEQEQPDGPPPPYVPIFHTRTSGDWGKLPSYQEVVQGDQAAKNEAFQMEERAAGESPPPEDGVVRATVT